MVSKSVLVNEKPYSKNDLVRAKKLVRQIENDMKDPQYRMAAKALYRYHTGREMDI